MKMREVLKRRAAEQAARVERARAFVEDLRPVLSPLTAWVYGSVATGLFKDWSDTDVLVVSDRLPPDPLRRSELLYAHVLSGIEPKGLRKNEFTGLLAKRDAQLLGMLRHRLPLIDELGLEPLLAVSESQSRRA